MSEVLLFHHALGLTPGVRDFAARLRAGGHTVHTADLYDGEVFDSLEAGVAHAEAIGFDTVRKRGLDAASGLPDEVVYVGFSLGVLPAQQLAQTRPGARGAVLCEACMPPEEFGASWPTDVPVQVHGREADPFFGGEGDLDAARAVVEQAADGRLFLYQGEGHLFAEPALASYDEDAATALLHRVVGFLNRV